MNIIPLSRHEIEPVLKKMLAPSNVDYLHIHFAAAGCYAAKVESAQRRIVSPTDHNRHKLELSSAADGRAAD